MDYDPNSLGVGFYGKLPAKGDFLTRHLPRRFVSVWDDWLQGGLAASRESLGDDWLDIYLTSPLWRFALSAGVCGERGWAGLIMPSMDRVGRYFPFTVAKPLPDGLTPLAAAITQRDWFLQVEELSLAALNNDDTDPGILCEDLSAITLEEVEFDRSSEVSSLMLSETNLATGVRVDLGSDLDSSGVVIGMASAWLDLQIAQHSFWWTRGSDIMSPSMLIHPGLPTEIQFCALLDGSWLGKGWSNSVGSTQASSDTADEIR